MHVLLAKLSGQANDPSALESSGTKRRATPTEHAAAVKVVSYTVRMFLKSICYSVIGCYTAESGYKKTYTLSPSKEALGKSLGRNSSRIDEACFSRPNIETIHASRTVS